MKINPFYLKQKKHINDKITDNQFFIAVTRTGHDPVTLGN